MNECTGPAFAPCSGLLDSRVLVHPRSPMQGSALRTEVVFVLFRFSFFIFREKGREGKRRRETSMSCLSSAPYRGPGLQPRHVP